MADQAKTVRHSFEDDTNTDPPSYAMPDGGAFVCDSICKAGSITLALMTRNTSTGTWVAARDSNGTALTKDLSSSDPHWHIELLAHGQQEFFLDPSSSSSVNCDVTYGRVGN